MDTIPRIIQRLRDRATARAILVEDAISIITSEVSITGRLSHQRPLKDVATAELELELLLRTGPRYKCQDRDCGSLENSPGKFDCCPACGKKGFLGGGFERNPESSQWKEWEARMITAARDRTAADRLVSQEGG